MADYPDAPARNARQENNSSMVIAAPTESTSGAKPLASDRYVDQQWRDVVARGDHKIHALSLNRDSSYVTTDPF